MGKKRLRKGKVLKMRIRRDLLFSIFPLIMLIILFLFRSCLFSVCNNTQHTNNCCPLAYYKPIDKIGDEIVCVKKYTKEVLYEF